MLAPYRVLDLTDDRGEIAGMVLADLGADVIRVEPPEGSDARRRGPWLADASEGERSLQFFAYNRNKRSIALDFESAAGRSELAQLVASADFVLESMPEGLLARHGFGFAELCALRSDIVHVQVSPYGTTGPYANFAASDLTIAAMGGPVSLQGVPESAPVRVSLPQVWRHAGAEAAVAALVAHARMRLTGEPQRVDVSAQCAMTWTMLNAMEAFEVQGRNFERNGSVLQLGIISFPLVFDCADGHVVVIANGEFILNVMDWMLEDGIVDASWRDVHWPSYELRLLAGQDVELQPAQIFEAVGNLLRPYKKLDLLERGLRIQATIAPVNTIADLLSFPHLAARRFFEEVELPDGRTAQAAGAFALAGVSVEERPGCRVAPQLDEHGSEIRAELEAETRIAAAVAEHPSKAAASALPFAGLKIVDFSWIGVGPITAKYFADHGATVVRVETSLRPDKLRAAGPFKNDEMDLDRSAFFSAMNSSKLGVTIDLKKPAGVDVAKRLLAWADIALESFTPGAAERLGLGYEAARALNPGIVMLSTCLMGQTGPSAQLAGYGYHAGAVAGFYELTGWADTPPLGPWMAYTDTIAPRFCAATLMSALDHKRRTGEGRWIDGAQLEMGLQFLGPELLDYQLNGHLATRVGNRDREFAPHGVYPCAGEDQWCAIAVETEAQWSGLRRALREPAWAQAEELQSRVGRFAAQDVLDEALGEWTRGQTPRAAMEALLAHGVPAGVVNRSSDLLEDPQYQHRGFYRKLEHAAMGLCSYAGHQFRIDRYDSGPRTAAPTLGQHTFEVLDGVLGMDPGEIAALMAEGVLE